MRKYGFYRHHRVCIPLNQDRNISLYYGRYRKILLSAVGNNQTEMQLSQRCTDGLRNSTWISIRECGELSET
ncbi:MAG: hypothetical protein TR69_WS6001000655 [candidate division WS6 bacterium OLB20]|uniref:Uncharacterized protein n=1 Tax=candidate division WS6 bacterium OLB20 TaxID=1617426 RepID=A0A136LYB0_9BACT|nr:MAG: hypothetical protein TR69_WS6001000655 [candidate division WS6 bacterium OLB20]